MTEADLKEKIEELRKKLVEKGKKEYIFTDESILKESKELDSLINEYYKNQCKCHQG